MDCTNVTPLQAVDARRAGRYRKRFYLAVRLADGSFEPVDSRQRSEQQAKFLAQSLGGDHCVVAVTTSEFVVWP